MWIILFWFFIPLFGYLIHRNPGMAYFPLLFPAVALLIGYTFEQLSKRITFSIILLIFLCAVNFIITLNNDYFLTTRKGVHGIPPAYYNIGMSFSLKEELTRSLV